MMKPYDQTAANDLRENIGRLHTTEMGAERIKRNIHLEASDAIRLCQTAVLTGNTQVERTGKNWYITVNSFKLTVNAHSCTVITAHMISEPV